MTGTLTTEAIIFSIHSAIKMGNAFGKAYATSLKSKSIVLPLPSFNDSLNFGTIKRYFSAGGEGHPYLAKVERLQELQKKAKTKGKTGFDEEEMKEYESYYEHFFSVINEMNQPSKNNASSLSLHPDDLAGLLCIRQWEKGTAPGIRPLQMVAGSLVEIGIDYFNMVPGAIRSDSSYANLLRSFLDGIDNVTFADGPLKNTIVKQVVPKMFVSVAESLDELSADLTNDKKLLGFINATSEGLTQDICNRVNAMSTTGNQEEVVNWGQMVFKSLIKNSGTYVFSSPDQVFNSGQSQSALIQAVGTSLMGAILDNNNNGIDLKNAFTVDTLDKIVKSSLTVVAQYPAMVSGNKGIKNIIVDVADTVAKSGIQQPGLVPELVRLVLIDTAGNLDQLWNVNDANAKHLLVTAAKQILTALSAGSPTSPWRPKLTNQQILGIAESMFGEVVQNQAWVEDKVNDSTLLGEVLNTTFNALGATPEGKRLNFDTIGKLIKINLRTVASSKAVLKKVKWGSTQEETTILNKALDLVFAFSLKGDSNNKTASLFDLTNYIMDMVVSQHPDKKGLVITQLLLNANSGVVATTGINKDLANQLVKATLGVISANPALMANDAALQNIIAGVAQSFQNSGIQQEGLLGEFIRMALLQTSGNLELMIPDSDGKPKQLIVIALKNILDSLTTTPGSGKWRPKLSGTQILSLSETLLDEVVRNPNWVSDKVQQNNLLQDSLNIIFTALEKHPEGQRISFDTLEEVIEMTLRAAAINKLILIPDPQKETILQQTMDLVFDFVYKESSTVDKSDLLIDVLDYMLETVIVDHPNKEGLVIVTALLQKNLGIISSTGINEDLANQLIASSLNALAEHPELVSDKTGIKNIVSGVTSALVDSGIKDVGIINEFIRLTLENTAGNLNLIVDSSNSTQNNILVLALQQVLKAISKQPASGKWKPQLTPIQILQITELITEEVLANPKWVKNNFIQNLIEIVYKSMEQIPIDKPLHFSTIEMLIEEAIGAVDVRMNLAVKLVTTNNGSQKIALTYGLEGLFKALFDESKGTIGTWTLTQSNTLNTIIHYYLSFLTGQDIDKKGMDVAIDKIKKAMEDLNNDVLFEVQDLLDNLDRKIQGVGLPA